VRGTEWTAERVLAELTPGMRMRILFDTAKAATWIAPVELETLFAEPYHTMGRWITSGGGRPGRRGSPPGRRRGSGTSGR
jgi:hypothetical protein